MKTIVASFLLCAFVLVSAMDNQFIMHEICTDYDDGMEIFSIDFDNDGDFDLLTAGADCILWLNDGSGNFSGTTIYSNPSWARSIRAADLDNDDDNDIVLAALASNLVVIIENTETGFIQTELDNSLVMPHTIDLKDLDGDGDIDILCSEFDMSNALSEVVWWRNDGDLGFSDKIIISEIFQQSTYVFADFINSDDDMDVVACGEILNDIVWWENDGTQNFGDGIVVDPYFNRVHTIVGNDLDEDGDIDILGAACMGGLLAWWDNDGEGGFTRNDIGTFGGALWMGCADFDLDGDNDLFAVGQGPDNAYIYENLGDEVFDEFPLPGLFEDGFSATAQDFDNDGDIDLAAIGRSSGQICWWENKLYSANFTVEYTTGNAPYTATFADLSNSLDPITAWFWDFDNDGSFDGFEQNPTWTYEEPGTYSVLLVVLAGENTISYLKEDYIQVFNDHTALEFDSVESHIICPSETSTEISEEFTVESWIYPYSYGSDAVFGWGRIFDKTYISIFLNNVFVLYPNHSIVLQMQHADGTLSSSASPENSIQLNEWIHVAISYDGVNLVRIFINGDEIITTYPTAPSGIVEDNINQDIYLGNLAMLNKSFDGVIDEVRVWDYFMDQGEVIQNMNKYLHGFEDGLVHYWQINEGNGAMILDKAGDNAGVLWQTNWIEGVELDPVGTAQTNILGPVKELSNYPNPFNPSTTISFSLTAENAISAQLGIYNLKGQKVKTLDCSNSFATASTKFTHSIIWNGTDDNKQPVASGIYFFKLKSADFQQTRKMMLLK